MERVWAGQSGRARVAAAAALVGCWLVFFGPHILTDGVPYYRDNLITNLPLRLYLHQRLRHGELPQWYPFESLGVPFIGQIATGLFHPATWLLLPLSPEAALKWNLLLAYLVAAVGAFLWSREAGASRWGAVAGGLSYAFGGYALGVSSVVFYAMSQATLPWVAWAGLRLARQPSLRAAAVLAAAWALVFLAGDALMFLMCGFLLLAMALVRRRVRTAGAFALSAGVAALLCGAELLPALVVSQHAVRRVGVPSSTLGLTWALHPLRLPELIVPGYIPDEVRYRVVGVLLGGGSAVFCTTVFAGVCTLGLAAAGLAARRRVALSCGALAAAAVWLALGDRGGLLTLAGRLLPLLTQFRYPEKFLALFWLSLPPLVGLGTDHLLARPRRGAAGFAAAGVVLCVAALAISVGGAPVPGQELGAAATAALRTAWRNGLLWSGGFALLLSVALEASRRRLAFAVCIPLLVFAELWHGNGGQLPLVTADEVRAPNAFAEAIRADAPASPLPRVIDELANTFPSTVSDGGHLWTRGTLRLLRPDASGLYGLGNLAPNLGAQTVAYASVFGIHGEAAPRWGGLFGGCYRVTTRNPRDPHEALLAHDDGTSLSLLRSPCRPRAYLTAAHRVSDAREALAWMSSGAGSVPWEGPDDAPGAEGDVAWRADAPEHQTLEIRAAAATALVVSDELTSGWTARIDDQEAPLYATNVLARGIAVPAGTHRVDFTYRAPRLTAGLVASALGLLVLLVLLAWTRVAPRLTPPEAPT